MSETVLVVDDDPDVSRFVEVNLRSAGYDVSVASDGVEAVERLQQLSGALMRLTRAQMLEISYPDPTVDLYFCLPLEALDPDEGPPLPSRDAIGRLRARLKTGVDRGEPLATTWLDVARSIET